MKVLVLGATGYVGGRLIPRLVEQGHEVRVLVRDAARITHRSWSSQVEVRVGDLLEAKTLKGISEGIQAAYYLVHSMQGGVGFAERDRIAALHYAQVAHGIPLTLYLGGLQPKRSQVKTSTHLESRCEVGEILREKLPVTEFRAGPIIGSGSASFEMVRYLTDRLPAMITPKWVKNAVQPIAIRDMLAYLLASLEQPPLEIVEVGMPALSFLEMMQIYAEVRGYRRFMVPLPVLAPTLAALWVGFVTPIPNRLAVPLIQGVIHPLVADVEKAQALFPQIRVASYREAVERAVEKIKSNEVETIWSGALGENVSYKLIDWEGMIQEVRVLQVAASSEKIFQAFSRLGGKNGWLVWNWAWRCRGILDRILGGPGLRRGRRHPTELLPGEAVDFWRVEACIVGKRLLLRAEMKVPGQAWLQWEVHKRGESSELVQTAFFRPRGLGGVLYWYGLYPIHQWIFSDLIQAIAQEAEKEEK